MPRGSSVLSAPPPAAGCDSGAACSSNGAPHWLQNRIDGSFGEPQARQVRARTVPQLPQKREPAGFSTPQLWQAGTCEA
jgi:hypothetical protein